MRKKKKRGPRMKDIAREGRKEREKGKKGRVNCYASKGGERSG